MAVPFPSSYRRMPRCPHLAPNPRWPRAHSTGGPGRGRARTLAVLGVLCGALCTWAPEASAQPRPMFDRFVSNGATPEAWQAMVEVPAYLRPQIEPDAEILRNVGANLVVSFRPRNRLYFSRSYGFAQMDWAPKEGSVQKVQLTAMEISEILNVSIKRVAIWNLGVGIGLMSGLIRFDDGGLRSRYEPYLPVQTGFAFYPFGPVMLEAKLWHGFFVGPGPVVSATRGLIGLGYNF